MARLVVDKNGMVDLDATARAAGFSEEDHCDHGTHPDDDCEMCDDNLLYEQEMDYRRMV